MKKLKILCLGISLFLASSLLACGGSKTVKLTKENYQDYLDVRVTTSEESTATIINVSIKSRNSAYVFDNCSITISPILHGVDPNEYNIIGAKRTRFLPKDSIKLNIKRDGSASPYSGKWGDYNKRFNLKSSDGKVYQSVKVESYNIDSITGKKKKNPLS